MRKITLIVYVVNQNGRPLMPCKPSKARKLLRDGRAKVERHSPFTIRLLWNCEEHVQEVVVGIDKGSRVTGVACVSNSEILLSGEIQHRRDVKKKLDNRRAHRHSRRSRKWYRPARFENRASSKRSGRLAPSIKTNADEVIRAIKQLPLPISHIIIEDVQVDIARINNPHLTGRQYQDRTRLDENLRMACLIRDNFTCQQCGKCGVRLEAHHIVFREKGGKDTLTNLLTLCAQCHRSLHQGKIHVKVTGVSGYLDQIAQHAMQGKAYLYTALNERVRLSTVFGYQTAVLRKIRGLPKAHDVDALCIATFESGEMVPYHRGGFYKVSFRPRRTRRRYHDAPRKGLGRVKYQVNSQVLEFCKGDIVRVKGKYIKQIISIYSTGRLAFKRKKGEPPSAYPRDCQLLKHRQTTVWELVAENGNA